MARLSPLIGKGPPRGNRTIRLIIRIAIIILALGALALSAWGIWLMDNDFGMDMSAFEFNIPDTTIDPDFWGDWGDFGFRRFAKRQFVSFDVPSSLPPGKDPLGLMIYTSIQVLIVVGGALLVEYLAPRFFYRVVVLIGYVLTSIIAIAAWAFMASSAADYGDWNKLFEQSLDSLLPLFGYDEDLGNPIIQIYAAEAAAAAAMAVAWLLVVIETILFVRACMAEPNAAVEQGQAATSVQEMPPHKPEEGNAGVFHYPPQPTQSPLQGYYYPPPQEQVMPTPISQQAALYPPPGSGQPGVR